MWEGPDENISLPVGRGYGHVLGRGVKSRKTPTPEEGTSSSPVSRVELHTSLTSLTLEPDTETGDRG